MTRRSCLLACVATLLLATSAQAGGIHLRWDACAGDGGVRNKSFSCATNAGVHLLYVSFVSDQAIDGVTGFEVQMDFLSADGVLPDWWQFHNTGTCRERALVATAFVPPNVQACLSPYGSVIEGGMTGLFSLYDGGPARLSSVWSAPTGETMSIAAGQEYFVQLFAAGHDKTTGAGSCAGCATPLCIGVHSLVVTRSQGLSPIRVQEEPYPGSSTVSWQGASAGSTIENAGASGPGRTLACSAAVPARNSTWGAIKSLYR